MRLRIAVGGFLHESHSFAPMPTTYADFTRGRGKPRFCYGPELLEVMRGCANAIAGAMEIAEEAGAVLAPLAWAAARPAGQVQEEAFERISALICAELSKALDEAPVDGVYLDLHGAGVSDGFADLEGELLRRVRRIVGAMPITISLDPHANLTAQMVDECDAVVPYRTYPHVDMRHAGATAMRLLLDRIKAGRPLAKAFRQLDWWMPLNSQCTMIEPMASVMTERARIAAKTGVAELAFCFGFPYADFADCGPALAAYAETEAQAAAAADALLAHLDSREAEFGLDLLSPRDAVALALQLARNATRPVVIADTQDNPGGGGHGDTTGLLAELVAQRAEGAALCLINDAESAASCHEAGEGAAVKLSLGGKSDRVPFPTAARVLKLSDGRFALTGPMGAGNSADLGPSALIEIAPGIRVVVTSRKMQALDQAILRHLGIEPSHCPILVLKSSVHFRADFAPIAERILVAAAPGPVVADPATLPFRNLRPGLRLRPAA